MRPQLEACLTTSSAGYYASVFSAQYSIFVGLAGESRSSTKASSRGAAPLRKQLPLAIIILIVLFAASPRQQVFGQQQHVLSITIQAKPPTQPASFGIYSTFFPVEISILIRNLSTDDFPGGNVTGRITPPSGGDRYYYPIQYSVPKLSPEEPVTAEYNGFKPLESGVYTMTLKTISTHVLYNPEWTVSGGFLAIDFEPASTLIELWSVMAFLLVGFSSIFVAIVVPDIREGRRKRRLDRKRRLAAYRLLRGILRGIEARSPLSEGGVRLEHACLMQQEVDRINEIIADYHDVLEDSTASVWDATKLLDVGLSVSVYGMPTPYVMDLRKFAEDVEKWYLLFQVDHSLRRLARRK
jgi:hypothetical protein